MTKLSFVEAKLSTLDSLHGDAIFVPVFDDQRPPRGLAGEIDWRLCGRLCRFILDGLMQGGVEEHLLFVPGSKLTFSKVIFFGAGSSQAQDEAIFERVVDGLFSRITDAALQHVCMQVPRGTGIAQAPSQLLVRLVLEKAMSCQGLAELYLADNLAELPNYEETYNRLRLVQSARVAAALPLEP